MKKKIKSILAAALSAVFMCGALAACGGNAESDAGEVDETGNTIVKIMFHVDSKSAEGVAYKKRIDAFNRAYADRKIKANASYVARSTGASNYETDLTNKKTEGTLADIITFDAPNCAAYANSDILYDISDIVPAETQNDFISLNKYNGKLYGLPIQESSAGFYYNKKIFREAGVDVSGYTVDNPWTFEQFRDTCERIKNYCSVAAVDMRLDANKDETAPYLLYPLIYAAGGSFSSEDGFTAKGYFDSDKTYNGFNFIKGLLDSKYTSNAIGATDFFTGKVGMYLSSGWTIPDIENDYKATFASRDDWGILPYPMGEAKASATGSWCFGITDNHHPDKTAAKELLLWMTTPESAKEITDATGMIPARRSVQTDYENGSPEDVLLSQLKTTGKARPSTIAYPKFSSSFNLVIGGIKNGTDLRSLLSTNANELQTEMNKHKK